MTDEQIAEMRRMAREECRAAHSLWRSTGQDNRIVRHSSTDQIKERLHLVLDRGMTQEEAAFFLGCSVGGIKSALREMGRDWHNTPNKRGRGYLEAHLHKVRNRGLSLAAAARELGCTRKTLRHTLRRLGLALNDG